MPKIRKLRIQLSLALFLLISLSISGIFIFGPSLINITNALSGNYAKSSGEQLTADDWNLLDDDFVAKSGDTMAGPLTLPGNPTNNLHAATKQYVDSAAAGGGDFVPIAGGAMTGPLTLPGNPTSNMQAATKQYVDDSGLKDALGNPIKMICGVAPPLWQNNSGYPDSVYIDIDTRVNGQTVFSETPMYFTSIICGMACWRSMGASAVYNGSPTGFRVYIQNAGDPIYLTAASAISNGWVIRWCGIGK